MRNFDERLREAWLLRAHQRLDRAEGFFFPLWCLAGFSNETLPSRSSIRAAEIAVGSERVANLLIFRASLLRRRGLWDKSSRCFRLAEKVLVGRTHFFYLYLERNCRAFAKANYADAYENGLLAIETAPDFEFRCSMKLNTLLALENLGVPCAERAWDLRRSLSRDSSQLSPESIASLKSELDAFDARSHYHQGRFGNLFRMNQDQAPASFVELEDFTALVAQLPYHSYHDSGSDLSRFAESNPFYPLKQYKLNTLLGVQSQIEGMESFRFSPWADRIYLWTWRWLTQPDRLPLGHLLNELLSQDLLQVCDRLSPGDSHSLLLSLSWLSLFDPTSSVKINWLKRQIKSVGFDAFPLARVESLLICYLAHCIEFSQESRKSPPAELMRSSIFNDKDLHFKFLLWPGRSDRAVPPALKTLRSDLAQLVRDQPKDPRVVFDFDLISSRIWNHESGRSLSSPSVCQGIRTLYSKNFLSCSEFSARCFGIIAYDPWTHQRRVARVLKQCNELLRPHLNFGIRQGRIQVKGNWEKVRLKGMELEHRLLANDPRWLELLRRIPHPVTQASTVLLRRSNRGMPRWRGWKSWLEIHTLIQGTSRSTTHRQIRSWIEQGALIQEGKGKATRYSRLPFSKLSGEG